MLPVFFLVLCIKSEQEKKPRAFKVSLKCISSPSPPKLADSHHVPQRRLAWTARATKGHFQHKHMIMCADLSVRLLLAQGQERRCQCRLSCAPLQGRRAGWSQRCAHSAYTNIISHFNKPANNEHSFVRLMMRLVVAWPWPTLCLLSGVKVLPGERLTPWTRLWTQPGITSDTRTLRTHTGI